MSLGDVTTRRYITVEVHEETKESRSSSRGRAERSVVTWKAEAKPGDHIHISFHDREFIVTREALKEIADLV